MPLGLIVKISLIHKIKSLQVMSVTHCQEAPQSLFLYRKREADKKQGRKASLTVEAALVFPIALLAVYGVLFFFCVLQTSLDTKGALAATGSRLALELTEEKEAGARSPLYFYQELKEKGAATKWIAGGMAGVRWLGTETGGQDVILRIQYQCKLPVPVFGIRSIPVSQQVMIRKWVGDGDGEGMARGDDAWVYVTANGSVYHCSRECTHLQLSIHSASEGQAKAGYRPCQKCGSKPAGICYYVTEEGDRYHTTLSCSGLKRTIYLVRLSEVAGYSGCSRCCGH